MISPFSILPFQPDSAGADAVKFSTQDALEHNGTFWMPEQASTVAGDVDNLYYAVLALNIFFFVAITLAVVYFCWKYRYRKGGHEKPIPSPSHNDALEVTWTIIPSIILVFFFLAGWRGYIDMSTPPRSALEIKVTGQKWDWFFTYKTGPNAGDSITTDELHVPLDRPVRLVMTSKDVIHSFFVPAFRIKQDVVPARYTYAWFTANKIGEYRMYCAEYCGTNHSLMKTKVVVHEAGGYESYLEEKDMELNDMPPVELGKKRYALCVGCHSIDGTKMVGPTFKGLFGKEELMKDGSKVKVDENYLRESIEDPAAKIVKGFQPVMPPFKGQLRDSEIDGLIEYIKSLK